MNPILARTLEATTPRFNDKLVRGIAKETFEGIPEYLNEMIQIALNKLNKNMDLQYKGYRLVTPEEELMEDIYSRVSGKSADIAHNNVYLCCFEFTYNGQPMPKYIYLPYAQDGNIFVVSGTSYVVMPVLTDLVISISPNKMFVRLHMDKISVQSELMRVTVNGEKTPELIRVIYTSILKGPTDKMRSKPKTPLGLYLLAKFGLQYVVTEICKLQEEQFLVVYDPGNTITPTTHPNYNIYSTKGEKPKGFERQLVYRKHAIKVLIDKKVDMNPMVTSILAGIMHTFDLVNGTPEEDLATALEEKNLHNELMVWRILLGRAMYKSDISIDKIIDDVKQHIYMIDDYVDDIIKRRLGSVDINIEDFWELLIYIIDTYTTSVNNAKEYNRDINNVYLGLLYYICYDMIAGSNRAVKQLNQRFNKNGGRPPSKDELKRIINNELSEKAIFGLVKSSSTSIALAQADVSNDSLYFKLTALLENQNRGLGVRRGGKTPFPESIKTLSATHAVFGSPLYLIKHAPSGTLRANPFAKFDFSTGRIIISEELQPTVDALELILRGVTAIPDELKHLDDDIEEIDEEKDNKEKEDDDTTDDTDIDNDEE